MSDNRFDCAGAGRLIRGDLPAGRDIPTLRVHSTPLSELGLAGWGISDAVQRGTSPPTRFEHSGPPEVGHGMTP